MNEGGKLHEDDDIELLSEEENNVIMEQESEEERPKTKPKKSKKKQNENEEEPNNKTESIRDKYPGLLKQSNSNSESRKEIQKNKSWTRNSSDEEDEQDEEINKKKKVKKTSRAKEYVPEIRSGAYAILITMLKNEEENDDETINYMLKSQLIKEAQKHSDSQFVSHDPKNHYTAWNSMSNLIKKNLVDKENKLPARYRLTESGRELAKRLLYGVTENNENKSDSETELVVQEAKIMKISATMMNKEKQDNCIEILSSDSEIVIEKSTSKQKVDYVCKQVDSDSDELADIDVGGTTGLSQQFSNSKITETNSLVMNKYSSIKSSYSTCSSVDKPNFLFSLLPGSFDIILFIDNCETNA